jgi:hypothetical protein
MKNIILLIALIFTSLQVQGQATREIDTGVLNLKQLGSSPTSPVSGKYKLYAKDGKLRYKGNDGVEKLVGSGSGDPGILENGGFEDGVTGWTLAAGTASLDTSIKVEGEQAYSVVLAGQALSLKQSSTTNASSLAGLQGLAYGYALAPVGTEVKLCAVQAGTTSDSLCDVKTATGAYQLFKIPFNLSATSSGVEFKTTSTVTGTVKVDKVFLGAVDLKADVDQSRIILSAYTPTTSNCQATTPSTTATWSDWNTDADCPGLTTQYSEVSYTTTDIDRVDRITVSNLPAGKYLVVFEAPFGFATAVNGGAIRMTDGTTIGQPNYFYEANYKVQPISEMFEYASTQSSVTFKVQGYITSSTTGMLINAGTPALAAVKWKIYRYSSGSVYSSTNADTDWAACNFSTLAWQGLGTVTNNLECKRQGSDLLMRGSFTTGTVAATEARIPLPLWNGVQLTGKKAGVFGRILRNMGSASAVKDYNTIAAAASQNYFGVSYPELSTAVNPLNPQLGTGLFSSSEIEAIDNALRIPINGWENSNVIIGQFNGLESCTDSYECTDLYSSYVDGTNHSQENLDWISSVAFTTPTSTVTLKTGVFSVTPNCTITGQNSTEFRITAASSTSLTIQQFNSAGANSSGGYWIHCQKQGADYIGKTAKAVASDQNVRSIGAVGVDIQSVYFGQATACTSGNCTINSQVGSKITTVSWQSAGEYRLNGIDGTKYICTASAGSPFVINHDRANSTTTYARILARNAGALGNVSDIAVTCIGIP